jgi:hypothetical protein
MNGDPAPWKANVSRGDDGMINAAWGAHEKGWDAVSSRYDRAAARFRDADATPSDRDRRRRACLHDRDRARGGVAGQEQAVSTALRVTHVFRKEEGS